MQFGMPIHAEQNSPGQPGSKAQNRHISAGEKDGAEKQQTDSSFLTMAEDANLPDPHLADAELVIFTLYAPIAITGQAINYQDLSCI